jgi:GntR family transcriptional regulator
VKLNIDFRSEIPIYLQIVEQVQQLIMQGTLQPNDQLPTVRAMATELRVNFNTVARAYRVLDQSGLISTQKGRGTYILAKPSEETMKELKKKSLEELTRTYYDEVFRLGYNLEDAIAELKKTQPSSPNGDMEGTSEDQRK